MAARASKPLPGEAEFKVIMTATEQALLSLGLLKAPHIHRALPDKGNVLARRQAIKATL